MLSDFLLPPGISPPPAMVTELALAARSGPAASYAAVRWTAAGLGALAAALGRGGGGLRGLPDGALLDAWAATVEAFRDPSSPERRDLEPALAALCRLSPAGLEAGLEAVLGGVRRRPVAALLERAAILRESRTAGTAPISPKPPFAPGTSLPTPSPSPSPSAHAPIMVLLASNLPALAVQPLLPALALRRPVLLKSPSAEPLFAPSFLAALVRREPRLAGAVAAVTWPGGDAALEAPLLAACGTIVAYGGAAALADLARRAPGKRLLEYGPKTSLAVVDLDGDPDRAVAAGLARDVALFDQRGCLSVTAVYVAGGMGTALRLAEALEVALAEIAARWPPGPAAPATLAAVQQARLEAELRGLRRTRLPPGDGTVLVEPEPQLVASPGLRTVRVHPLADPDRLPGILAPWNGLLQGAALSGPAAWRLAPRLAALGVSRCAAPGDLQSPDAAWHNGGIDPLLALSADG